MAKIKDVVIEGGQNESVGIGARSASLPSKNFRAMRSAIRPARSRPAPTGAATRGISAAQKGRGLTQ
jgi:hypothetical protein